MADAGARKALASATASGVAGLGLGGQPPMAEGAAPAAEVRDIAAPTSHAPPPLPAGWSEPELRAPARPRRGPVARREARAVHHLHREQVAARPR